MGNDTPPVATFEDALARLEQIVREMEDAALPLQRLLLLFEEGTQLGQRCQEMLDGAELRIRQVTEGPEGVATLQVFDGHAPWDGAGPAF